MNISPAQAIIAAADGVKAAMSINTDLQRLKLQPLKKPKQT